MHFTLHKYKKIEQFFIFYQKIYLHHILGANSQKSMTGRIFTMKFRDVLQSDWTLYLISILDCSCIFFFMEKCSYNSIQRESAVWVRFRCIIIFHDFCLFLLIQEWVLRMCVKIPLQNGKSKMRLFNDSKILHKQR